MHLAWIVSFLILLALVALGAVAVHGCRQGGWCCATGPRELPFNRYPGTAPLPPPEMTGDLPVPANSLAAAVTPMAAPMAAPARTAPAQASRRGRATTVLFDEPYLR